MVAGSLLDRYKVMILAPTIVFSVLLAAGVGAVLAYSLWSIFVMVVVLVVAVQLGYLARIAVRGVAERFQPKVERTRLAKAIEREREQAEHEAA